MVPPRRSRSATSEPSSGPAFDEADLNRRITDEYKILQDKIDKIGAFRFTIKGWSVTAVIGATVASSGAMSSLTVLTVTASLMAMLVFFFRFELEQVRLSRAFGRRAIRLENAFISIDRRKGSSRRPFPVPYMANEIVGSGRRQQWDSDQPRSFHQRLKENYVVWKRADIYFYAVLLFLACAPLVARYSEIKADVTKWVNDGSSSKAPKTIGITTVNPGRGEATKKR